MANETVSGVVEYDPRPNAQGFWSVKVNGTYYGTGKFDPKVAKGDNVSFSAVQNAKGYWDAKGPVRVQAQTAPAVSNGAAAAPSAPAAAYANKEEAKQKSISWQAARNSAIEFMTLLRDQGGLAMPTAAKSKPADVFAVLSATLTELTQQFFDESQNPKSGAATAAPAKKAVRPAVTDTAAAEEGADDAGWENE